MLHIRGSQSQVLFFMEQITGRHPSKLKRKGFVKEQQADSFSPNVMYNMVLQLLSHQFGLNRFLVTNVGNYWLNMPTLRLLHILWPWTKFSIHLLRNFKSLLALISVFTDACVAEFLFSVVFLFLFSFADKVGLLQLETRIKTSRIVTSVGCKSRSVG